MARIEPLPADQLTDEQKELAATFSRQRPVPVRGPFAVLLRTPDVGRAFSDFVDLFMSETRIPIPLKELAIITVAREYTSQYEWFVHAPRAMKFGISADVVEDLRNRRTPNFTDPDQKLVYETAQEMVRSRGLSDASYARALERFGEEGMIEFAALVGFYHTVSVLLNTFQVEAPEGDPNPLPA